MPEAVAIVAGATGLVGEELVRQLAAEPGGDQYTALLRELFDLEVPQSAQAGEVPDLEDKQ